MSNYIGEYEVTIDAKGRFMIPTGFKRQLNTEVVTTYVISRGFESCLTLYTNEQWKKIEQIVNGLNDFNPKSRILKRKFLNGATPIEADGAGRLLVSKQLLEHAGITKDAVFSAQGNKVEIWDTKTYHAAMEMSAEDYSNLASEVLGSNFLNPNDGE